MDYYDSENYNVDYEYYINQAYKIIHNVDRTTERLEKEAKEKREQIKKDKEEENYLKFVVNKIPTELQYKIYNREWLQEKYGVPGEIRPSKVKV